MKKLAVICGVLILVIAGLAVYLPHDSHPGKTYQEYEIHGNGGDLRVIAQHETSYLPGFVMGAYFTIYARPHGTVTWKHVMQFRHDDPILIPRHNLHVSDGAPEVAFIGWMAAVSSDSGLTWSVWDGSQDARTRPCLNYGLIKVGLSPTI